MTKEIDKLEYFMNRDQEWRSHQRVSYNQWLQALRKVSLKKRKRREDAIAIFRYMKDLVIPEKAIPKGRNYRERDLGSEQEFSCS